jgi:ATP-dependent DNA helicase RecQ
MAPPVPPPRGTPDGGAGPGASGEPFGASGEPFGASGERSGASGERFGASGERSDAGGLDARIGATLVRYWGFDTLRPLQREAVDATLARRDSLVVLPTGGGKSLCYQLPPLLRTPGEPALCLVVSPLIALMKDQVDGLRLAGYPAAALHGGVPAEEAADIRRALEQGRLKLLLVSPERLLTDGFLGLLAGLGRRAPSAPGDGPLGRPTPASARVACIAIDEAHCISQWGHDFRPEYRRIAELRAVLPGVPIHAYTATATPRVRDDIVAQLQMVDPVVLVGTFDRPNLTYRVLPRVGQGEDQVAEILGRHTGEAAIVYCISRKQTESLADALTARGLHAAAYHAGLDARRRSQVQDDFLGERLDIVVATVAFGMGIDRGDVRCVVHASMPKSVEAYQQETGRAGRDGLPAECVLLYSAADAVRWGQLVDRSAAESDVDVPPEVIQAQKALLAQMQRIASGTRCRHRALSEYFGQAYVPPEGEPGGGCNACDVCSNELEEVPDSTTIARKILSCVARLRGERGDAYGAAYVADVLRGSNQAKIIERGHTSLSTFGLLRDIDKDVLVGHLNQLVDLGALVRDPGEYPVLRLTGHASPILRGEQPVRLLRARAADVVAQSDRKRRRVDVTGSTVAALSREERGLFDALRQLRREHATTLGVPPYVVFGDAPLEEMARVRPGSLASFASVKGVGRAKLEQFGEPFITLIRSHCAANGLALDAATGTRPRPRLPEPESKPPSDVRKAAFELFERGMALDDVANVLVRARSTTVQYLLEHIERNHPATLGPWVPEADYQRIVAAADSLGGERMKPLFDYFDGDIAYDTLRLVLTHRRVLGGG